MCTELAAGQDDRPFRGQTSGFEETGWIRVRNAFDASGMVEELWRALGEHGMRPDDPTTWKQDSTPETWLTTLCKLGKSGTFAGVANDAVNAALRHLLGDEWTDMAGGWGRPLVTFPTWVDWDVPTSGWHLDMPPAKPLPAVRMFAYLDEVGIHGGGTLVVEGSHQLATAHPGLHSPTIRRLLARQYPWFREIWHPTDRRHRLPVLMDEGAEVNGARVRVVELTGQPGDVVLWHPSLFHVAAPNTSSWPRFMLTHTARRQAL